MDKQKKQLIITAGLILVLVIVWANTFKAISNKKKGKLAPPAESVSAGSFVSNEAATEAMKKPLISQKPEVEDDSAWGRCPFSGKVFYGEAKALDLKLTGILWDEDNPQAIINDEIREIGQKVGKFKIIEILPEEVIVSDGTEKFELKIY